MERIIWLEISSSLVASVWTELEAFALASMRGLWHNVRHNPNPPALEPRRVHHLSHTRSASGKFRLSPDFRPRVSPSLPKFPSQVSGKHITTMAVFSERGERTTTMSDLPPIRTGHNTTSGFLNPPTSVSTQWVRK